MHVPFSSHCELSSQGSPAVPPPEGWSHRNVIRLQVAVEVGSHASRSTRHSSSLLHPGMHTLPAKSHAYPSRQPPLVVALSVQSIRQRAWPSPKAVQVEHDGQAIGSFTSQPANIGLGDRPGTQ
jgi:hypothetical protein